VKVAVTAAAISLLYAACSWHFMEKPVLEHRTRVLVPAAD
jgi:peptidoglycan/LPS O-acetylase OafA/YrhL